MQTQNWVRISSTLSVLRLLWPQFTSRPIRRLDLTKGRSTTKVEDVKMVLLQQRSN